MGDDWWPKYVGLEGRMPLGQAEKKYMYFMAWSYLFSSHKIEYFDH